MHGTHAQGAEPVTTGGALEARTADHFLKTVEGHIPAMPPDDAQSHRQTETAEESPAPDHL